MKRFPLVILSLCFALVAKADQALPTPLDGAFAPETVWETPAAQFVESNGPLGFRWVSSAHDTAQTTLKGGTLFGLPVYQALTRFEGEKLVQVTALFYNRGDAGEIDRTQYEALIRQAVDAISTATKTKFTVRGKDASSAVKAEGLLWTTEKSIYLLEYSATKEAKALGVPFRAEFVRLEITPRAQPRSLVDEALAASKKAGPFQPHLTRDAASGDVVITGIPMVDQGAKGYCVVASAERVLRYYGVRVDANELAQLANSSAKDGTSVAAMTESLKKLTARLKIRVRTLEQTDVKSILTLIADYNRLAKRAKTDGIDFNENALDLRQIYSQMKPELLREARTKNRSALSGFEREVKSHIEKRVPILWSVTLGIMPEGDRPLPVGGHMRLIIGYNEKTDEIVYSDSWGMGHEMKRMASADAWSMTMGMATIEPF
jgi:hypothetical protein